MNYPADGFSIVPGTAEQKLRLDKKKLWNNDYYAWPTAIKALSTTAVILTGCNGWVSTKLRQLSGI